MSGVFRLKDDGQASSLLLKKSQKSFLNRKRTFLFNSYDDATKQRKGGGQVLKANERRQKILEILCVRRQETMENLAQEFNVTIRTIRNDIEELTLAHPIETVRGRYGGGVRVADGYYLGRKYLKPNQQELLKRLSENLTGEDLATMNSILSEFALTKRAEK